jgi:hypothetical protein
MAADIYPDTDELFERIGIIQEAAIPESAQTGTPAASVTNYPYWITLVEGLAMRRGVRGEYTWDFTIGMRLVRTTSERASVDLEVIKQINNDMVATMKEFGRRLQLQSTEYPTAPSGMVRDSVLIEGLGYGEIGQDQEYAGSGYTLTFSFNILVAEGQMKF